MTRWTAAPALVVAMLGLAACSSAVTPASPPPASPPSSTASVAATPSASTGIPVSTSSAPARTSGASAGAYPAAEVCAYLQGRIPVLTAIGSPAGRGANLAANLFGFFSDHGIAPDGYQLEAATAAQCPAVRSQLLTLTGLASLAEL